MDRAGRGTTNEIKHPYVVELSVVRDGLDVELSRRIMQFHKSRHIQLRHGRRLLTGEAEFVIVGAFPIY